MKDGKVPPLSPLQCELDDLFGYPGPSSCGNLFVARDGPACAGVSPDALDRGGIAGG